jgi:hypothetical protein
MSRRISDGRMLHIIKGWLTAPVAEVIEGRPVQTTEARRTKRGTPLGGVISPLLANGYFWRFLLAWRKHGHQGTRRQLCRRFRHLLPTAQRRGGDDTNDGIDDGAWGGGERNKGPDRPAA